MPRVAAVVAVETRRLLVVGDKQVQVSVPVVVEGHHSPALAGIRDAELSAPLGERAVAVGDEAARRICLERPRWVVPAVHVEDVEVAVVVEIGEGAAPSPPPVAHPGPLGDVLEHPVAGIPVEPVPARVPGVRSGVAVRIPDARYEPVEVSVVVVVPDRTAHAVLVGDHAAVRDVAERAVAVVEKDPARAEVARDEEIRPAVVVDVGEIRREAQVADPTRNGVRGGDARRDADVAERAVAVVVPQLLRRRRAEDVVAPVGEEQIEKAVPVVVAEGRRVRVAVVDDDARARRDILERPIAAVAEQREGGRLSRPHVSADAGNDQVEPSVAVEVGERRTGPLADQRDAGPRADLLEGPVAPVVEEQVRPDVATDDVQVDPAVAVVVAGGDPARDPGGREAARPQLRVPVLVGEPGGGRDVRERPRAGDRGHRPEQPDQQEAAGMHTAFASGRRVLASTRRCLNGSRGVAQGSTVLSDGMQSSFSFTVARVSVPNSLWT